MKKRGLLTILFAFVSLLASALSKDSANAVVLVSYEQSWLDREGTLALKNNTEEDIHNVSFIIKYLDMSGRALDYEEFFYDIEIAPGMTKKLDIPAYENDRSYHYYKTKDEFGHPAFKIKYELKGYNLPPEQIDDDSDQDSYTPAGFSGGTMIIALFVFLMIIGAIIGVYVLVAVMAQKRNRSVVAWLLLSFIATPLLIIIILLCIGDSSEE